MKRLITYFFVSCIVQSYLMAQTNVSASSSGLLANSQNSQPPKKWNVVFFLVDDLGWTDVGYQGSTFYETPNLDTYAKRGVRFSQAYAACHVCSPTRASILTGQYPARLGLTDWLPGRKNFTFQKLKTV